MIPRMTINCYRKHMAVEKDFYELFKYIEPRFVRNLTHVRYKKFIRVNKLHKLDILFKRTGRSYCASIIWDAEFKGNKND